jgi:hypothetical protein
MCWWKPVAARACRRSRLRIFGRAVPIGSVAKVCQTTRQRWCSGWSACEASIGCSAVMRH